MRDGFALGAVVTILVLFGGCSDSPIENDSNSTEQTQLTVEQEWGVEIVSMRLSSAGHMLDFRYKVIDPDKAARIASRKVKAILIDQETGTRFAVPNPPKIGPLRQTSIKLKQGKTYFVLFTNPGRFIKQGNKVTVQIGNFVAQDIVVQ